MCVSGVNRSSPFRSVIFIVITIIDKRLVAYFT
jgi:hypothetical protein